MKRYGNLYDKVTSSDVILEAIRQASKGKRQKKSVKRVLENKELYVMKIQDLLISEEFKPSTIAERRVNERGKDRIITSSPFYPDQIIHWAIMLTIQPILLGGMYEYTLATIKNRGSFLGKKMLEKWVRNDFKNTKYTLKMDVKQFYPSINHSLLKNKLKRKFKDKRLLDLMFSIIDSYKNGLPLGLYTSQWFANFYLTDLDHAVKNDWGAKYYLRYMDDLVVFGSNKRKLHKLHLNIKNWLIDNDLSEKNNWQVFKTSSRPIDFLGYKFYRTHTTLRKKNALYMMRSVRKIKKKGKITVRDARKAIAFWGWIKNTNSYIFYHKHIKPYISVGIAKDLVSKERK